MGEWISFADRPPPISTALDNPDVKTADRVLVTNCIDARDRMGRMSNVWLLTPIECKDGGFIGFNDGGNKVYGLTHWKDAGIKA